MTIYRERPWLIEARQVKGDLREYQEVAEQFGCDVVTDGTPAGTYIVIPYELGGTSMAKDGDYIIRDRKGRVYTCPPDVFEDRYEPVEGDDELP